MKLERVILEEKLFVKFGKYRNMSRIGKKLISIPKGVDVIIEDKNIKVKGPKGELSYESLKDVTVVIEGEEVKVTPNSETKDAQAYWGLTRALIANMIVGVTEGYSKTLELIGVGYTAFLEGKDLVLKVGYSHPVKIEAPEGITFEVKKNVDNVTGIDKTLVGQVAANIRKVRKPEPYKGKGIKYTDEVIRRKEGKKAAA
jgi:large subunit ribosomal protein L6